MSNNDEVNDKNRIQSNGYNGIIADAIRRVELDENGNVVYKSNDTASTDECL